MSAEPADTAALRGRKRHAKTDKTDSRHLRQLLADGRLPECWIPPSHILECRALLETYHDLRVEHTAWTQRIHAVLFHQGAPQLGEQRLRTGEGLAALRAIAAAQLSPAGQLQIAVALDKLAALDRHLDVLRRRLLEAARQLTGARELHARLYGVGPVTALALVLLAGRGGPVLLRPQGGPVRRAGHHRLVLRPQGPARAPVPAGTRSAALVRLRGRQDPRPRLRPRPRATTPQVKDRIDGKRAAISEARKIIRQAVHILAELGDDALSPGPAPVPGDRAVTRGPGHGSGADHHPMGITAASSRQAAVSPLPALPRRARGRPAKNERPHPPQAGGHPINHHVAGRSARRPRA